MNALPTLPVHPTPYTDRLYEFAMQEQAERCARHKMVLHDKDYRAIAKAIREKEDTERTFENGCFYDSNEIKLILRGIEINVFYDYKATGEICEEKRGYADYGEKVECIHSEEVSEVLCEASEDIWDIDFDQKKLIQYFNEPII